MDRIVEQTQTSDTIVDYTAELGEHLFDFGGKDEYYEVFSNALRHGIEHIMGADAPPHVKGPRPDGWQIF